MNNKKQQTNSMGEPACSPISMPDWKIERYLLGELPNREMDEIRRLEETDSQLRRRIDALRTSNAELIAIYPPEFMARKISNARKTTRLGNGISALLPRSRQNIPSWAVPVFSCAALLLIVPMWFFSSTSSENLALAGDTRVKGIESRLEVWRKAGPYAERLSPGADVAEGDLIQLRYMVPEVCYGAIVSIDGRGHVTVHLSGENGVATRLTPGRPVALDHSYELDDAQRFEIFYLITAPQNFDVTAAASSIKNVTDPEDMPVLSRNQRVTAFELKKN